MATWPAALPQDPLLQSFAYQVGNNLITSEMDAGPVKVRRRFTAQSATAQVAYLMTEDQRGVFDTFFREELAGGALPFNGLHPISNELVEMRFDPQTMPMLTPLGNGLWRLEANLLILTGA